MDMAAGGNIANRTVSPYPLFSPSYGGKRGVYSTFEVPGSGTDWLLDCPGEIEGCCAMETLAGIEVP